MSTKTSIKRIALVAVSALGFGLLSVMPAKAASTTGTDFVAISGTLDTGTLTYAGRVNQEISIPVTMTTTTAAGDVSASTVDDDSTTTDNIPVLSIAASVSAEPSGSAVALNLDSVRAALGTTLDFVNAGSAVNTNATAIATGVTATSSTSFNYAVINYSADTNNEDVSALTAATVATVRFTPTVAGTYKVTVWNETRTFTASPASEDAAVSSTAAVGLSGSESFQTFTINVSAGVSTITLTPVNTSSVEDAAYGSLVKVEIKDAAGNAAALTTGESISLDPTGDGKVAYYQLSTGSATFAGNFSTTGASAGAAYSLSNAMFFNGVSYVNITDATAETVSLVATLSSNSDVRASTSITFRARASASSDPVSTLEPKSTTVGWAGSTDTYTTPLVSSITYSLGTGFVATGSTTTAYAGFTVEDISGKITGVLAGRYDVAVNSVTGTTVTISATFTAADQTYNMSDIADAAGATNTAFGTTPNAITAKAADISAATINGNITDTIYVANSSLRVAPAGTASFTALVSNQFGQALQNARVVMSWSGRNTSTSATQKTGFSDADGYVTLTYTDTAASTVSTTSDTVTFTAYDGTYSSTSTATVNWLAVTVGTLTLTSTGDTDVIAGTTTTDISAGVAGATATSATASALVKDANGVIIVGTPVTFTVTGLVGAEVHTTKATVYTDSTGTAVSNISSYAAGKATVTATAGTVTATDDVYFKQATATEARTISATVSGGTVTATVKDRYGNPIEGVTVNATRTGTGFFGSGASTSSGTTDKNGVVEFIVTGDAVVTVAFTTTTYGQSAAVAGRTGTTAATAIDAYVAGTATVDQEGLGGSLAPAGVNSASVTVVGAPNAAAVAAEAASDAAAEAIDAANAATDAANLAAEAADAATVAAEEARDAADAATAAVEELATQVATLMAALKAQITTLANTVAKIAKKVKA